MGTWRTFFGLSDPTEREATTTKRVLPRVLYKYLPVARCHHWLIEQTVAFVSLELLNDPYEGVILGLQHTGAGATRLSEDMPVRRYRVGQMIDYGVNPSYDENARRRR